MKPLYWIAVGLCLLMLVARTESGFDIYSDAVGWVFILAGLRMLVRERTDLPLQQLLWALGGIALVIAAIRVAPDVDAWVRDTDAEAGSDERVFRVWADIPALAFQALLAHVLAAEATLADARGGRVFWRIVEVGLVVGTLAAGLFAVNDADWLAATAEVGFAGVLLCMFGCLIFGSRAWAGGGPPPQLRPRERRR